MKVGGKRKLVIPAKMGFVCCFLLICYLVSWKSCTVRNFDDNLLNVG